MEDKQVLKVSTDAGEVTLSPSIVRKYLVNGNGNVTDQEIQYFLALCKFQRLNPFLKEVYLVKYGNSNPASIVVGKEAFTKRARKLGAKWIAGLILMDSNGELRRTNGVKLPGDTVVGGWAMVTDVDGNQFEIEVPYDEYEGRKSDGTPNRQWAEKPGTMVRKVALCQALREAFPADFTGMYSPEEMSHVDSSNLSDIPAYVTVVQPEEQLPKRDKKKPEPPPPDTVVEPEIVEETSMEKVTCPQSDETVNVPFCTQHCPSREGCPAFE